MFEDLDSSLLHEEKKLQDSIFRQMFLGSKMFLWAFFLPFDFFCLVLKYLSIAALHWLIWIWHLTTKMARNSNSTPRNKDSWFMSLAGGIPSMIFVAEKCNAYFKVVKQEKKIHVGNLDRINQNLAFAYCCVIAYLRRPHSKRQMHVVSEADDSSSHKLG